ncbi:MAG: hypothetical protein R3228_11800 [Halioglobus sp.]|nr:hypothetical protein [Halioglobus sp.]
MRSRDAMPVRLPNGETATFEQMQSYGETLQRFIREQEAALPSISDVQRHNQIIDYLQLLADAYNQQLRVYKDAESHRQRVLLLSLVRYVGGGPGA